MHRFVWTLLLKFLSMVEPSRSQSPRSYSFRSHWDTQTVLHRQGATSRRFEKFSEKEIRGQVSIDSM